ncbi:hypothetical protein Tco_1175913 [Tanacetum coccineum]
MAEQQTIKYDPQWNNMTVDNVTFQTNNMNFLREFWSTAISYDPFPSTDETEQHPLKEFLIKFLVLNGKRPLTLDFNTFCSSTGLDYNNGKYVAHPTPEAVKKELGKIAINLSYLDKTPVLKNSFHVLAYCLITGTGVDIGEIIYSDLITKLLNKSRLKYVSYPRFISCALQVLLGSDYTQDENFGFLPGIITKEKEISNYESNLTQVTGPEASRALSKKRQKPKSKKPPTETKVTPPKPMEGSEQSHSVSSGTKPDPQDLERNIQLASTRLPSTLDEGTRAAKTTPRPKGSLGYKDLGGNIPPADMEPIHPLLLIFQGLVLTGEEMDEDPQTASIAETYHQSPPPQADKPQSSLAPSTKASDTDSSCDDILKKYDNTLPLTERQLVKYLRKVLTVLFDKIIEDSWEKHQEAAVNYANLKASIDDYYDENIAHRDQTNKLVEASMSSLDKSSTTISDIYKGINLITKLLKEINNAVKDDPVIHKKINEATESFTKISTNIAEVISLVKGFNFADLQASMNALQAHALKQDEELAAWAKSSTSMAWNLGSRL